MPSIDLNADVGEGFGAWSLGDDEGLLAVVTSANVACGFHAGDPATLLRTCRVAAARGVAVGAQVGYRDLAGFGRRFVDYARADLVADVLYQVGALDALARAAGTRVGYVKPHGALYGAVVHHEEQAGAVVEAVAALDDGTGRGLPVLGLPGSALLARAERAGLPAVPEAFADRGYAPDATLVPRSAPGALVTEPGAVAERAVRMATRGTVLAVDGTEVRLARGGPPVASVCVHGDTPGAAALAGAVRAALEEAGVRLAAFTGSAPVPGAARGRGTA